eukprot:1157330-Pelagomonas_calceolata.AAC.5
MGRSEVRLQQGVPKLAENPLWPLTTCLYTPDIVDVGCVKETKGSKLAAQGQRPKQETPPWDASSSPKEPSTQGCNLSSGQDQARSGTA